MSYGSTQIPTVAKLSMYAFFSSNFNCWVNLENKKWSILQQSNTTTTETSFIPPIRRHTKCSAYSSDWRASPQYKYILNLFMCNEFLKKFKKYRGSKRHIASHTICIILRDTWFISFNCVYKPHIATLKHYNSNVNANSHPHFSVLNYITFTSCMHLLRRCCCLHPIQIDEFVRIVL